MQQLNIKKITTEDLSVASLSAVMDQEKIEFNTVGCVNWDSYPYKPKVKFRIAHTDNAILLNYQVEEDSVKLSSEFYYLIVRTQITFLVYSGQLLSIFYAGVGWLKEGFPLKFVFS